MSKKNKSSKRNPKPKTGLKVPAAVKKNRQILYFAILAAIIVFFNSLSNGFVNWDDPLNLLDNPNLNGFTWTNIKGIFTSTIIGNYNPLPIFTFAVEKALFGLNPVVYHFNNLLLHIICVFFVFKICESLRFNYWVIIITTILFAIHPMRVESVAWVTERKDVLFGAFYLSALFNYILFLKSDRKEKRFWYYTLILFAFSLLAKIQAVALPLSMLAIDYYLKRPLKLKLILEKIPFFLLSLATGVLGIYFLKMDGSMEDATNYTLIQRVFLGAYAYSIYVIKSIFPYEMSPLYPYSKSLPSKVYFGVIGVLLTGGVFVWAFLKQKKTLVLGLAFFTFNVMFVLQVVGAGQGLLADRFTYIPYFGLFLIYGFAIDRVIQSYPSKKTIIIGVVGIYLLIMAVLTIKQNQIWKNGETLWSHVIRYYPNADTPWQNRGKYRQSIGEIDKAVADFNKAIAANPESIISYNSRGKVYFDRQNMDAAIKDFSVAISKGTDIAEIYINRGSAYATKQQFDLALEDFNEGIRLNPNGKQGYLMRSLLYLSTQQYEKALPDQKKVIEISPNNSDAQYEVGMTLNSLQQPQEALKYLNQAIQLNPNKGIYYFERAKARAITGNKTGAQNDGRKAKQLGIQFDDSFLK